MAHWLRKAAFVNPALVTEEMIEVFATCAQQPGAEFSAVRWMGGGVRLGPGCGSGVGHSSEFLPQGLLDGSIGDELCLRRLELEPGGAVGGVESGGVRLRLTELFTRFRQSLLSLDCLVADIVAFARS